MKPWLLAGCALASPVFAIADPPLLVWDVAPELRQTLPRSFRTTRDPLKTKGGQTPDANGLASLRASGSAEFTADSLKILLSKLPGPVTVFDLRQEDHGFVNGEPISWFATNNWANVGKTNLAVVTEESERIGAIAAGSRCTLNDDRAIKGGAEVTAPEVVTVRDAQTESQLAASAGVGYVRITVSDHSRPTDAEVDRFLVAVRGLPTDAWAHFHCRAGKGRTTTFMALYDMLRNAPRVSLADIVSRQSLLAGDYDLMKSSATGAMATLYAERAAFIRSFYDYARANPDGRPLLWSEWLKRRG